MLTVNKCLSTRGEASSLLHYLNIYLSRVVANQLTHIFQILHTTMGDIHMRLYPEECPRTVENFTTHCRNGYYDNLIFHRVIRGFMIQTGDPLGDGTGGQSIWGREFEDEFHKRYIWFLILFRIFPCTWTWVSFLAVSQHAFKFWPFSSYFLYFSVPSITWWLLDEFILALDWITITN